MLYIIPTYICIEPYSLQLYSTVLLSNNVVLYLLHYYIELKSIRLHKFLTAKITKFGNFDQLLSIYFVK